MPNFDRGSDPQNGWSTQMRWTWLLIAACVLVLLMGLFRSADRNSATENRKSSNGAGASANPDSPGVKHSGPARSFPQRSRPGQTLTAEEIVANKVAQFGRNRRETVRSIARRLQKEVPLEVEQFFDAIESGNWADIDAHWKKLAKWSGQYQGGDYRADLDPFWPSVLDAYGVAEQAHEWPPQQLLDYGQAILGSLRPGMVYVGGTDHGRWVPELLSETSDGEQHVVITQNALADGRYLEFLNTLYGDRLNSLTSDDSQRAFKEYHADAARRFQHDQQYPDEPKQVLPGENIKLVDGRVEVSGQVAVMAINEKLLQLFMQKNPDLSFAMQESFPLRGTYANAVPLGPIFELRAPDGPDSFTAERASQSLNLWRSQADQLLSGSGAPLPPYALRAYSHDAAAAANLLAAHNFTAEAEETYRQALRFWPENPETVGGFADVLMRNGRPDEARQVLENFTRQYPNKQKELEQSSGAWKLIGTLQSTTP